MNGPVTGMSLNRTPSSTAGTADRFSSVEERCGHGLSQHSEWRVSIHAPKDSLTIRVPCCRKMVFAAGPMLPR